MASKKRKPFKYKGHTALGVKKPKTMREVLRKMEKLNDYERSLVRKFVMD